MMFGKTKMRTINTIHLCLADNVLSNVVHNDSTTILWEKLKQLYIGKSLTNNLYLKQQLYRLKIAYGANLLEHLNVFNQFLNQLHKVNVKVDEEYNAILLLTLLPDSYDNLITMLLFVKDTISLEDVMTLLLSNEIRRRPNLEGGPDFGLIDQVENCKGMSSLKGSENCRFRLRGNSKVQCFNCKEYDHIKKNCLETPAKRKVIIPIQRW